MALTENLYCFCGIWVYMIISIAASPANRRAVTITQTGLPANVTQNGSVCWSGNVAYNNGDVVLASGPCEQCVCNAPDIVCSVIKCETKTGCKIIQNENQCCPQFKCDCEYNNKTFYNGEKIDTPDTPCRVCYCKGGEVMCSTVGCYERDDCEGKMVPGTCCLKYDHCPPLDENNRNVKITQTKTDSISPRGGGRGLQPWSLDSANVTVHPSIIARDFDLTTERPELTMIMQRINPNPPPSEENITSAATDFADTAQPADAAQEALNTIRVATQPAATTPADSSPDVQESSRTEPDLPTNATCALVTPAANSDLVSAVFANTEVTEKSPESTASPSSSDSVKPLVDMEKSTMAILQQLLDVKTTIEPLTAETNEALVAETIEPVAAATIEQIAAKIAESIATSVEPAATVAQQLPQDHFPNMLGKDLTVRASVFQSENASRHAAIDDGDDVEIANVTLEKQSKSAVTSDDEATTTEVAESAMVQLLEKGMDGATKLKEPESSNGTVETVVTATASVTVVSDPANGTSTTSPTTQPSSTTADATEIAQVVLLQKNSSPAGAWEDLGTAVAHVTVSYDEENKINGDLGSSPFPEDLATEVASSDRSNSSETSSTPDGATKAAATVGELISNATGSGNPGAVDSHSNAPLVDAPSISAATEERTEVNVFVLNFSQPEAAETTSSVNSGIVEMITSRSGQPQNDQANTIEFTTLPAADVSGEEEASSSSPSSAWTESTVPSRLENGAAATMTYTTDSGYNLTEVEKVELKNGTKMAANLSAANEQLPFEMTTVGTAIKDEGDVMTSNASTELPMSTSAPSSPNKTDPPATEVTRISELSANDTTTVPSNSVESVTFTNQIRLDVADQLPQSFFVESFFSPLNSSVTPSNTYPPSNDFPFEIFFNTNYSDSAASSPPANGSLPAANSSDPLLVSGLNATSEPPDGSNYTKIFAQKIVVHPVKVVNSVNSVYLSPGMGFREGTTAANFTESGATVESSTDVWNSTEGTAIPETTFEDANRSTTDTPWRNVSQSNYKILLDSLTDAKVKPFTKVPKVTGAPLSWLKKPAIFVASSGSAEPSQNSSVSEANTAASVSEADTAASSSEQPLKNESRSEPAQAKVYDPLMPYPEEYPEEYQTIQNGPAIIITRTTYTRIPDVTYTTVTMATLPTYQQVQKAEDGFAQTLFERKLRERSFSKEEQTDSTSSTESTNKYFNIDVKKIEDSAPSKKNLSRGKSSSDRRMPDPPLDHRNYIQNSISVKGVNVEAAGSRIPALDEKDMKIVQNFMNKHLRLR